MATRTSADRIVLRYRTIDSAIGVAREIVRRLAERLGVDETQAIHLALHDLAAKVLPRYKPDDGPMTATQLRQIRKRAPQRINRTVRSSLFNTEAESCGGDGSPGPALQSGPS